MVKKWPYAILSEIGEVVTGSTPSTQNAQFWGGSIPFVTPGDMDGGSKIRKTARTITEAALAMSREIPANSVLVTCIGATIGKAAIATSRSCTNQQINAIICNSRAEPVYVYYALQHSVGQLKALAGRTAIPIVSKSKLQQFRVPLPPRGEQRKIAAILASVDETIEKTEAVIAQLQVVKKAMMQELLTRGLPGRHTRLKDTELGDVPESWGVTPLGELLEGIDAGWSPRCEQRVANPEQWGVLKVSSVTRGFYCEEEHKALPVELSPKPELEVRAGDVLLARANGVLELVGRTCYVWGTRSRLMLSDKVLRLRPKTALLHPLFLHLVMNLDLVRKQVLDGTGGSHMRNVSQDALRRVLVPVPPQPEQEQIQQTIASVLHYETKQADSLKALAGLKQGLMSVLLTGEVRVTPDEDAR